MAKYANVEELVMKSIHVESGMPIVNPKCKSVLALGYAWVEIFNSCYAVHNSVLAFVKNNKLFVTPYTKAAMEILHEELFEKKAFLVPFSDGDFPADDFMCERWYALVAEAWYYRFSEKEADLSVGLFCCILINFVTIHDLLIIRSQIII